MRDPYFYDDMGAKLASFNSPAGTTSTAPYSETVVLPSGRLRIEFTPMTEPSPEDIERARAALTAALEQAWKVHPAMYNFKKACDQYREVSQDVRRDDRSCGRERNARFERFRPKSLRNRLHQRGSS